MRKLIPIASMTFLLSFSAGSWAADCVDVQLSAETRTDTPLDALTLFYSMANCGEQAGLADIEVSLEKDSEHMGSLTVKRFMQPDHEFSRAWALPIPPVVPAGSYRLCLNVALGDAADSACATIEIDDAGNVLSFAPEQPVETAVTPVPWSTLKRAYR